jgi:hypothetical protein
MSMSRSAAMLVRELAMPDEDPGRESIIQGAHVMSAAEQSDRHPGTFADGEAHPESFAGEEHVGTFAEGEAHPGSFAGEEHVGNYAEGEAHPESFAGEAHVGTYAQGEEQLPKDS